MSRPTPNLPDSLRSQIDRICKEFESARLADEDPEVEVYLSNIPADARPALLSELIKVELQHEHSSGSWPKASIYHRRFPEYSRTINRVFSELNPTQSIGLPQTGTGSSEGQSGSPNSASRSVAPECIGKYSVRRELGQGGFGIVYLAWHPQLEREVALKVVRSDRFHSQADIKQFLDEARNAARIKHPGIVTIYDVDQEDGRPFIVQEYIDGVDLAREMEIRPPLPDRAAGLIAEIAEAVAAAHAQGVYHCDLKPRNILIDSKGHPHTADFGLALRESFRSRYLGNRWGTPIYMSPEQVRGESNRIDGRCDVWSLGIILYEMLTGCPPFVADDPASLFEGILHEDPVPLRQRCAEVPAELERICLKCLSKRKADRYLTSIDLAGDLASWLKSESSTRFSTGLGPSSPSSRVMPKGLRSFDEDDAAGFLELLPDPRDREGMPEALRFWKSKIECVAAEATFAVGLIFGPSGSGKSSLVKAGLLPCLDEAVTPRLVEASPSDTEARLLSELHKAFGELPPDLNLPEVIAHLREGDLLSTGEKLLIVLDQFEQWLSANRCSGSSELIQALRQCDGGRIQCLIVLRDDFWMAATRFFRELEIDLVQGRNVAAVDRVDARHARKVLTLFGQAYGALPPDRADFSREHELFLDRSVESIADEGRVVSVQLALFAEMFKGKPWTPASLKSAGGIEGIGVAYLDSTFGPLSGNPRHRLHAAAAQEVLRQLLPAAGADIRGSGKSAAELAAASRYPKGSQDFDELINLLDAELRLITPSDPLIDGRETQDTTSSANQGSYQLTHDFLVPALREWLSRKQKETRRGRAQLRLEERTALWMNKTENRQLPSYLEWISIQFNTDSWSWSDSQRRMMRCAARRHTARTAVLLISILLLSAAGTMTWQRLEEKRRIGHFQNLVSQLWRIDVEHLPRLLDELDSQPEIWTQQVMRVAADSEQPPKRRARAYVALARHGPPQLNLLQEQLLEDEAEEHRFLRDELRPWKDQLIPSLWARLQSPEASSRQIVRAASALAQYDAHNSRWNDVAERVVRSMIGEDPLIVGPWVDSMRPVRRYLMPSLVVTYCDSATPSEVKHLVASMINTYGAKDRETLASATLVRLLLQPTVPSYPLFASAIQQRAPEVRALLKQELAKTIPRTHALSNERLVARQASAAVILFQIGDEDLFWSLLASDEDPRLRTLLIDRMRHAVSWERLWEKLTREAGAGDPSVQQAMLLALDGYSTELSASARDEVRLQLLKMYRTDPDSGIHSAVEWVLKRWGFSDDVAGARRALAGQPRAGKNWFVDEQLHTMIVIPAPGHISVGSPDHEPGRDEGEQQRTVSLNRTFAISAHEVTVESFLRYYREVNPTAEFSYAPGMSPDPKCPMNKVSWYEAAQYCRWLSEQLLTEASSEQDFCYPERHAIGPGMRLEAGYLEQPGYRLPTGAEWEYAARAGSTTSRFFGNDERQLDKFAWYAANSTERTWPVGSKMPNPLGLFDVYGNVTEWTDARQGNRHILRGGNYRATPRFLRSAWPREYSPNEKISIAGFRVVRTLASL